MQTDCDVAVIGAGISGLMAALMLEEQGYRVRVLEAQDRTGGRIHSMRQLGDNAEAGATYIGAGYARFMALCERFSIPLIDVTPILEFFREQELVLGNEISRQRDWPAHPSNPFPGADRELMPWNYHRVLTMREVDGYPLQTILGPGVERETKDWVAIKYFRVLWRQIFEFGVLHTDPNPGNYLVTFHPKLAILDFGSIRVFPDNIRTAYHGLAHAILAGDRKTMADCFVALDYLDPGDDPEPMSRIMDIIFEPVLRDREYDPRHYKSVDRGMEVASIAVEHRIFKEPGHRVFLLRALMGLDAHLKQFGTVTNWHREFKRCVERMPVTGGRSRDGATGAKTRTRRR